jgi:hypothetical protein
MSGRMVEVKLVGKVIPILLVIGTAAINSKIKKVG